MFNVKSYLKDLISPFSLLVRDSECATPYWKLSPGTLFQMLNLTVDPFFNVKWGHLTTKTLQILRSPLLLILRLEISTSAVVLFSITYVSKGKLIKYFL